MSTEYKKTPHISIAPMMDWTDRHFRYMARQISPNTRLYTEMVTTGAILHGDKDRFLRFNDCEHPIALQLGGSDPEQLAACTKIGEDYGYDEVNLNCGCPSDRVQSGMFGAILMKESDHLARCVDAMVQSAKNIPVTVKCRIGVDDLDDFEFLDNLVHKLVDAGCQTFIIHARKCWLKGLSPKENREIPVLDYQRVYDIKAKYPQLEIILNGGITDIETTQEALQHVDGIMIGREAYQNPYFLTEIERTIFGNDALLPREDIALRMMPYAQEQAEKYDTPIKSITRHMMGLFHEQIGAKHWRRALSEYPYQDNADETAIEKALESLTLAQEKRISAG